MSKYLVTLIYGKVVGGRGIVPDAKGAMSRKAVLLAMADRASDDGSGIYVSKTRIAAELECCDETVRNAAKSLVEDGLLAEVGRKAGRRGYTTMYQIVLRNVHRLMDAWQPSQDPDTLDDALGEDSEDEIKAPNDLPLSENKAAKNGAQSPNAFGTNRPSRTIERNPSDSSKSASRAEQPPTPDQLRWEAVRLRASDPERARELEQRADDLVFEEIQAQKRVEH